MTFPSLIIVNNRCGAYWINRKEWAIKYSWMNEKEADRVVNSFD